MPFDKKLVVTNHDRFLLGMKYVYPVVSRRAGGLSIGINLNVNNTCNWHCIYCQVPNLNLGSPPIVDLIVLEQELRKLLNHVIYGDFMERYVTRGDRQLMDIAFSGNGEPTSSKQFPQALSIVERVLREFSLLNNVEEKSIKIRLITNGSLLNNPSVLAAIKHLSQCNGEVWFQLDAGTEEGFKTVNQVNQHPQSHINNLKKCAESCPTYIQTCMFAHNSQLPTDNDILNYILSIKQVQHLIKGIHLYSVARPSLQTEKHTISSVPASWLNKVGQLIRDFGFTVSVNP